MDWKWRYVGVLLHRNTSGLDQNLQHWLHDTQVAFDDMLTQLFTYHDKRGKGPHIFLTVFC